jgi:hypothetical protein
MNATLDLLFPSDEPTRRHNVYEEHEESLGHHVQAITRTAIREFHQSALQTLELKKTEGNGWVDEEDVWERLNEVLTAADHGMFTCSFDPERRKQLAFEAAAACTESLKPMLEALDAEDEWTNFEILDIVAIFHEYLAKFRCERPVRPIPTKKPAAEVELDCLLSRMTFLPTVYVYPEMPTNPKELVSPIYN